MSETSLALKEAQTENYFKYHPDSIDIVILTGDGGSEVETIQGLFDNPILSEDAREQGPVEWNKRRPHLTIYSGNASKFTARSTYLMANGKQWKVRDVSIDKTPGTYQAMLWLV